MARTFSFRRTMILGGIGLLLLGAGGFYFIKPGPAKGRPAMADDAIPAAAVVAVEPKIDAANWPQFRGPDGSGVSGDLNAPAEWSATKNLKWKTPLPGPGSSSPIVWKDRVFITCYSGYGDGGNGSVGDLKRHLLCLDAVTGKSLWDKEIASAVAEDAFRGYITEHGYASNTPATDGERVYVFFGKTGVLAFDFDGKELWRTSVGTKSANKKWGSASSLTLYKNFVIVNAAEESRAIQALDKKTGEVVWKAPANSLELTYGTPLVLPLKDGVELVIAVPNEVWGFNPDTGKLKWFAKTRLDGNVCPSVVAKDDLVIAFGGYPGTSSVAVRAGGRGDVTATRMVWAGKYSSYVSSPVIRGDHLYWVNDRGIAYCLEAATGKKVHEVNLPTGDTGSHSRSIYAATLLLGDNLVAVTRRNGVFVVKATPELTQVARNKIEGDASDFNAAPAVSAGRLYLRSNRFLYCVAKD